MSGLINELPAGKRRRLRHQLCQETAQGCGGQDLPGAQREKDHAGGVLPERVSVPGSLPG
jgi:hypothetical protein